MSMVVPRALVVDDELQVQVLVGRALAQEQILCDFANDGAEATKKAEKTRYDIVVTDLRMPNVNGHALCQTVLALPDRPLLVAITGVAEPRLRRDLEARGVDAIFEKPLDFATFGPRIRAMIDERPGRGPTVETAATTEKAPAKASPVVGPERKPTVAILMGNQQHAFQLAAALGSRTLKVFVAETTDFLCRFAEKQQIDVLLIENVRHGFLSAAEVLAHLQESRLFAPTIVVGDVPTFSTEQIKSLGIQKVFNKNASLSDVVQCVRNTLVNDDRSRAISSDARALVRSFGQPIQSPVVLLKLTEYLEKAAAQISVEELARDVMADPATTAELMRLSNSSSLGVRRQITEVADCLAYLGPSRAVGLLLSHSIQTMERKLSRKLPGEFRAWYQTRALLTASVASSFAARHFNLSADTAFVLGLFQDMGILVMAHAFGDHYQKVVAHVRSVGLVRLHVVEQQSFGLTHAEVSAALVEHWWLPERLIRPIRRHHDSGPCIGDRNDLTAFLRPMRIGEAFADFWDNRHPIRKNAIERLLAELKGDQASDSDFQESLAHAVRKSAEFAALFRLQPPDESAVLAACKESLSTFLNANCAASEPQT
jgi:HD-like signal output (HDOD) protein/DNA-binding NarL/FixJ family response regulator